MRRSPRPYDTGLGHGRAAVVDTRYPGPDKVQVAIAVDGRGNEVCQRILQYGEDADGLRPGLTVAAPIHNGVAGSSVLTNANRLSIQVLAPENVDVAVGIGDDRRVN